MYGYIYMTTNITNNKKYIGQKKSDKFLAERYLGSGKILRQAIEKDGRENFTVKLIEECDNQEELNSREIYWISYYDAVGSDMFYNIAVGGNHVSYKGYHHSLETKKIMSESRKGSNNSNYGNHWKQSDELREIHRKAVLGENNGMYGKKHKDSTIKKLSENRKGRIHINNGIISKCINKNELDYYLSNGWQRGRILKNKNSYHTESFINKARNKMKANRWINNSKESKLVKYWEVEEYLQKGYVLGRGKVKW